MKKIILLTSGLLFCVSAQAEVILDSDEKRLSYTVGQQIGQQLQMEKIPVDQAALFKGISDFIDADQPLLDHTAQRQAVDGFQKSKQQALAQERRKNLLQGQAYLKANTTKRGVKATKSGLQYRILEAGTGPKPNANDRVRLHYEGRLIDGTVFDSSYGRANPAELLVGQNMQGWQEALPMMPMGSKWQITIPTDLAYGEEGFGDQIPANAVLVFDIEVFEILPLTAAGR